MGKSNFRYITLDPLRATGATIAAAGIASVPTLTNGSKPKYLRCNINGAVPGNAIFVTPKTLAENGTAATGFPLSHRGAASVILNVWGYSHIGFDVQGGGSNISLVPLADF